MKPFVRFVYVCFVFLLASCGRSTSSDSSKEEWMPLFNKKDLTGWDIKIAKHDLNDNLNNTFYVKDSILTVDYDGYQKFDGEFGHLYYQQPFSYYKLKIEYRFVGTQLQGGPDYAYLNSGVMLHSQSAASAGKDQTFPVSLEMQFLGTDEKVKQTTGNLCTPGTEVAMNGHLVTDHCTNSTSPNYEKDRWIVAEAIVLGDSIIHHLIEGDTVLTYTDLRVGGGFVSQNMNWKAGGFSDSLSWVQKQGTPLSEGYIALQAESQPIEFRKVELLNLKGCRDPKATNYKSYFIKHDPTSCRYE